MSAHRKASDHDLYRDDFFAWTTTQAALLRAQRWSEVDVLRLAEEVETLGGAEQREFVNRLAILLTHLLEWAHQAERRSTSWRLTTEEQRRQIKRHLRNNPSLKSWQDEALTDAFGDALIRAELETGLARSTFPSTCPYRLEQILDDDFWPEPHPAPRTEPR